MTNSKSTLVKTREERLAYLNSLQYSTLLKQKKEKFYLIIPELFLFSENTNLEDGYKDLQKQKQELIIQILDSEAEDEIVLPRKIRKNQDTFQQLKIFTYKLLIICTLFGMTFTIGGALIINKMNSSGTSIVSILKQPLKSILVQLESSLLLAPDETKRERLYKLHQLVEALRPYYNELKMLPESRDVQK